MDVKEGLYKSYQLVAKEETKQEILHKRHNIEDPTIKIVEKPMVWKFLLRFTGDFVMWVCRIALVALAAVGVICLIYPACRYQLIKVLTDTWNQIRAFTGL